MIRSKIAMGFLWGLLGLLLHVVPGAVRTAHGQGSRKDDIVFNSRGVPLAAATIRVCAMPATGQPCTPLALIYSDAALTQALANPTTTDGLGNYHFYAAPGRYEIEISGPGITTKQIPDVLISPDPSSPNFSGNISAFSLNLSGNLTVNGNTTVVGNLASGTLNLTNQSTPPGTATSGTVNLYTKTADKRVYYKDDAGTEIGPLGPGTGAQTNVVNTFTANQNFDNGMHIKGPDPYADITRFGKFATLSGTTANTTSGSASVALTSAQSFQNGEYVTIFNAGGANGISAMGTVTLTPSSHSGGLNSVAAGAGAQSFSYKVVAADKFGGYTAASAAASTTTGNALGMQTIAITSMARSARRVTVTTSAAHPFVVGSMVYIQIGGGNTDTSFNGWYIVNTVADNTHFTYDSGFDTAGGATTSDTGGTVIGFNVNHLSWSAVTGAWKYYIYGRTGGTFALIGVTLENFWDDFGSPMNDNRVFPDFIPTTAPSSGANDHLTAKINSGGGTTTLTLNANAGATLSGITAVSDDGPALIAACAAFSACYISSAGATVNSYTVIPNGVKMLLYGSITANDTLQFGPITIVQGWGGLSSASFNWEGGAGIAGSKAYPVVDVQGASPIVFRQTQVSCNAANGCLAIADYGGGSNTSNFTMENSSLSTGGGNATDYLGMHAIFQHDGFSFRFNRMLFSTGSPGANANTNVGFSPVPTIVFKNQNGQGNLPTGNFAVTQSWFVARSSFDQDYVAGSGGVNWILFKDIQTQNSFIPIVQLTGGSVASFTGNIDIEDVAPADFPTSILALLVNLANGATGSLSIKQVSCLQGSNSAWNGLWAGAQVYDVCNIGQNRDYSLGPFFPNQTVMTNNAGGVGYQLGTPAAPTVAISGGVGPAANTYTYGIAAVDSFGGASLVSQKSAPITLNGSQGVLVSWTPVPGQATTTVCRGAGAGNLNCPATGLGFQITGNSFLDTGSGGYAPSSPQPAVTGFTAGLGSAGIEGQQLTLTGGGFKNTISGTFTANRTATVPDVTGIVPVSSYANSAYENATRANGAIGSNWTIEQNGLNIASNQIQGTTAAQSNSGFWNANSFSPVQFAQATITALNGTSDFPGVTVLASGAGSSSTYYDCVENSTTVFMQRVVNAGTTNLTSTASTGAVGDILRLEIGPGGVLTCYKNGAVALTAADTQIASGSPGLLISGNVATEKNWSGGNLHPLAHLDVEQDWARPQHFTQGAAFGTETFTASPRAEQNAFLPGALTATWTGATWTTDKAVTITRVQVQAKTAPAGCTTNAIVRLTDGTTPVNVTISAAANDSGAISQNYTAGASLQVLVQTAAAGCTTSPADANVTVQYRMQ